MNENNQIIEINGIKMEVDLRHARRIDTVQVGTKVKVLLKSAYTDHTVRTGVVVGFEPFESLPTIIVCYMDISYSEAKLEFAYINSSTKSKEKYELVVSLDDDMPFQKQTVLSQLAAQRAKKVEEVEELDRKREYFLQHFEAYFPAVAQPA